MQLEGRRALITGASRGLGAAIARRFVMDGAVVALTARDEGPLADITKALESAGSRSNRAFSRPSDVSRPDDVHELVDWAQETIGGLDILVCNAGVLGAIGPAEATPWDEWVQAIQINLLGTVLCCRAVVPILRDQGHGKIITLSGGGATAPQPGMTVYAASKAGMVRFTETLAHELADAGIDVNAVAPGALDTRLLDQIVAAGPERVGETLYNQTLEQKQRGGASPERAAELVSFLASERSNGISGRLISAVWDDWENLPSRREQLGPSDVYTLRRIVPADRGWDV